jgi:cardiolipin synthase
MTCTLTRSGLGGSTGRTNRDFGVIETDARDVAEAARIFQADWDRKQYAPAKSHLLVSPSNARAGILGLIGAAQKTLRIEDEEMYDAAAEDALIAAARRGVDVEVLLPVPSGSDGWADDAAHLASGGVHVRYLGAPYLHAKLIVADGGLAFVGSQNFSPTSLDQNREVGVLIADAAALHLLNDTFGRDWAVGAAA